MKENSSPAVAVPIAPDRPLVPATSAETGPEILQRLGMDAEKWCAEFKAKSAVPDSLDVTPGSDFHGWMCNAIMNAFDMGHEEGHADGWEARDRWTVIEPPPIPTAAVPPTPDPAVMRDYIVKLTAFYIDNPKWILLAEEARGYVGALEHEASTKAGSEPHGEPPQIEQPK